MTEKHTLLFLIPSLRGGGAERVAANLIPFLSRHFHLVLVLLEDKIEYNIPSNGFILKTMSDELGSPLAHLIHIPIHLVSLINLIKQSKAELVLSFMEQANILNLLAAKITGHKTVITQHVVPSKQFNHKGILGKAILKTSKKLYPDANLIITVSDGIIHDLKNLYHIDEKNMVMIPNPIDCDLIQNYSKKPSKMQLPDKFFLCVGRLVMKHKAQDIALNAFKKTLKLFPNTKLIFAGEGADYNRLKDLADKLTVTPNIVFAGWRRDIWSIMSRATATILPSRYEGWPMVLIEAMAAGSPVIATDCPSGPKEILDNGRFGMLIPVEDSDALADAMIKMASSASIQDYYKKLGQKRAKEFDIEKIGIKYVQELSKIIEN